MLWSHMCNRVHYEQAQVVREGCLRSSSATLSKQLLISTTIQQFNTVQYKWPPFKALTKTKTSPPPMQHYSHSPFSFGPVQPPFPLELFLKQSATFTVLSEAPVIHNTALTPVSLVQDTSLTPCCIFPRVVVLVHCLRCLFPATHKDMVATDFLMIGEIHW